jgi:hypothetical protein
MSLVLKGNEFVATESLSANSLKGLLALAARRPLVVNGIRMCAQDLAKLAEDARRSGGLIRPEALEGCAACDKA